MNFINAISSTKLKLLTLKFISYAAGAALAIVLARLLGADGYGEYSFTYALILVMALPAAVGLPDLVMRETAKLSSSGDEKHAWLLWIWAGRVVLASSGLLAIFSLGIVQFTGYGITSPGLFWTAFLLVPIMAAGAVRAAALQALGFPFQAQAPQLALRPILFIILILILGSIGSSVTLSASNAMALHVLAASLALLTGLTLLLINAPKKPRDVGNLQLQKKKEWIKSSLWIGAGKGSQVINNNIDLVLLGILAAASDVGLYKVALVIGTTTIFAVQAIELAITPKIASLAANGQMAAIARTSSRAGLQIMAFGLIIFAAIILLGRDLITLTFGSDYEDAYMPLVIVALGKLSFFIFGPVRPLLNMTGNEQSIPPIMLQAVTINVLFCLLLIPAFGFIGAAIALFSSSWYWNIRLYLAVKGLLQIDPSPLGLLLNRHA